MTEPTLKPCPFCWSRKVSIEASAITASLGGNEFQTAWVECDSCQASGPVISVTNDEIPNISQLAANRWNAIPRVYQAGWISHESLYRLKTGGNCRGAVPIHVDRSAFSRLPVYVEPQE